MISFDSTVNIMPSGGNPLASSDESPCMPVSKLPRFVFFLFAFYSLYPWGQQIKEWDGMIEAGKASNQDIIMQLSMQAIV